MSKEFKKRSDEAESKESQMEETPDVSFENWFSVRLKNHKHLQAHHYPVILTFFKQNNLTEFETESKYDAMLTRFGY